jgi:hypothetical protein
MNINWQVQNMTRDLSNGFVINVAWACTASQDSASAFYGGTTVYTQESDSFIPYEDLTEEIVLGWVYETLGDQKAEIEASLTAKVEKQLNPVSANGLPWSQA